MVASSGGGWGVDDNGPGRWRGPVAAVGGIQRPGHSIHFRHVAAGYAENTHRISGGFVLAQQRAELFIRLEFAGQNGAGRGAESLSGRVPVTLSLIHI